MLKKLLLLIGSDKIHFGNLSENNDLTLQKHIKTF